MPEDIEKQLSPQEIADLFAFLCLDKPPVGPRRQAPPGAVRSRSVPSDGSGIRRRVNPSESIRAIGRPRRA